ncbi:hypothetical protein B296_00015728 [Ensete ventricosum]|uniref:Uncharacterized protein n=1 Tax=Ensete ventricosum TaxID=4639 RepID=A0A426ZU57_ENSVE|nr:hypothetical protein B296_00015728 [Ensete ventricosum]
MRPSWLRRASAWPFGVCFSYLLIVLSVLLIVPYRAEMFNLKKMKSGGGVGNRSTASQTTDVFASVVAIESLAEKRPDVDEGLSLRKRSWKETFEPLADASRSTTRVPSGKGKEPMAIEEAPELGYTLRVLCEVEDHMGAEKYFATIMMWMKVAEGEDPLMLRWSTIAGSSQF